MRAYTRRAVFIDSFSVLDDLTMRQCRDAEAVLTALRRSGRLSVWDMANTSLRRTVADLERTGRIRLDTKRHEYPWIGVEVLDPGGAA